MSASNNLLEKITSEQRRPLDNNEIMELVKNKAKVVLYEDVHSFANISQFLEPYSAVFLLYQINKDYGHWVAVIERNKQIEFFDPLGYMIDDQLLWTKQATRKRLNMDYPYLTKLLYEATPDYSIVYNEHKLQNDRKDIATCGAWSALRITYKHLPLSVFIKDFTLNEATKEMGENDKLVTLWRLLKDSRDK